MQRLFFDRIADTRTDTYIYIYTLYMYTTVYDIYIYIHTYIDILAFTDSCTDTIYLIDADEPFDIYVD